MQRLRTYCPQTRANYLKLRAMLDGRGVTLVCMQYPMRSVAELKKLFERPEGLVFVENCARFADALRTRSYGELFMDSFGGDFGHATREGNMTIVRELAPAVIEAMGKAARGRD